jgi:DNA-binding CsgD family transcriptional regulator
MAVPHRFAPGAGQSQEVQASGALRGYGYAAPGGGDQPLGIARTTGAKPEQAALLVPLNEGESLEEIAVILSLNPGSVGTLLARADTAFRKEYVNRHGER